MLRLLEVIEKPRHIYLVTEFVGGGELFDHIVSHGRLSDSQACYFFRQIILGVDACHAMNVIHRDVSNLARAGLSIAPTNLPIMCKISSVIDKLQMYKLQLLVP